MGEEEKDLDNRGHSRRHSGAQAIRLTGMRSIEQARMPVLFWAAVGAKRQPRGACGRCYLISPRTFHAA
jgi:hypothetical protein